MCSSAKELYQRALAGEEKVLGFEHPETLKNTNSLAGVLRAQGQYPEAEKLRRQTLASREKVLGLENSDTLQSVNNLASALEG
ncbi:hypothetical protein B0O99DRAFT_521428 [Bisporella sp. PMI_857]|nr:hypothetical protein B0O99DRAFT_521428 [Bisporella sp. PMI_857]